MCVCDVDIDINSIFYCYVGTFALKTDRPVVPAR